ncbi:MAG: response regulator transcription factor [Gemmatimonadetes bacterium]|nr:response regulator transcription factor [Gemmatimonadota bacterium]
MRRATVLICDDHPMVSQGLKSLLRSGFVSVGIVNDGRELVTTLLRARPDVLLLDVSMPHINGLELLPQVREAVPTLKVIVVTMHVDRALADLAISAGAHGFIPKEASADELNAAIEHVLTQSRPFISPHIPRRSFRDKAAIQHPELDRLTPRHRQILRMIGDGKSSQEMAELLGVSPRTVEFHRASIRKALGLTNEWGLIRFAIMMRVSEGDDVDEPPDDTPAEEND